MTVAIFLEVQDLDKEKIIRRILIYVAGLFTLANGAALTINSDLGVSPIVSLPLVVSEIIGVNIGTVTSGIFIFLILLQIIVLRKNFKWHNLTQIIFSVIFGYFKDFAIFLQGGFQLPTYIGRLAMMGLGFVLISLGIVIFMEAKLVPLPVEGLADALAQVAEGKFHVYKMIVDTAFVVLAIALALLFLRKIIGIREGTLIGMLLVGRLIPPLRNISLPLIRRIYSL